MTTLNTLLDKNNIFDKSDDTSNKIGPSFFEEINNTHGNEHKGNASCNSGCTSYKEHEEEENNAENLNENTLSL